MSAADPTHTAGTLPDHAAENRRHWDEMAREWVAMGERAWARNDPTWGIWGVPEAELELLPVDMTDLDAIELGCGTAYVSAWIARRGGKRQRNRQLGAPTGHRSPPRWRARSRTRPLRASGR